MTEACPTVGQEEVEGGGYNRIEDDENGQGEDDDGFVLLRAARLERLQVFWALLDQEDTVRHAGSSGQMWCSILWAELDGRGRHDIKVCQGIQAQDRSRVATAAATSNASLI